VIVVDNNSSDGTEEICRRFLASGETDNFQYVREKSQGLSHARNRGIREARGEYIAFIDDDAFVSEDYCRKIINFFDRNPEVSVIGGRISPVYEKAEPRWMSRFLWPLVAALDLGNTTKPFPRSGFPIGANMAFRAGIFIKYGDFNTRLGRRGDELEGGEEKDMMFRLKKAGEKIFYLPEMHVQHIIPESRLKKEYIRKQAIGVGISEKKRLRLLPERQWIEKIISESIKVAGTIVLSILYMITFKPEKGIMLVRFRFWVLKGYLKKMK
jgi:glycosyltransferase involved in cell wall biosynthesis